ncbi:hypothetical protein BR93DRAFT_833970 [Coniochaeta sp. PMI_546]|nr:hypothetical protein BR93DRAFT_833970 [Coniochaeta sp. PMI_546]
MALAVLPSSSLLLNCSFTLVSGSMADRHLNLPHSSNTSRFWPCSDWLYPGLENRCRPRASSPRYSVGGCAVQKQTSDDAYKLDTWRCTRRVVNPRAVAIVGLSRFWEWPLTITHPASAICSSASHHPCRLLADIDYSVYHSTQRPPCFTSSLLLHIVDQCCPAMTGLVKFGHCSSPPSSIPRISYNVLSTAGLELALRPHRRQPTKSLDTQCRMHFVTETLPVQQVTCKM